MCHLCAHAGGVTIRMHAFVRVWRCFHGFCVTVSMEFSPCVLRCFHGFLPCEASMETHRLLSFARSALHLDISRVGFASALNFLARAAHSTGHIAGDVARHARHTHGRATSPATHGLRLLRCDVARHARHTDPIIQHTVASWAQHSSSRRLGFRV